MKYTKLSQVLKYIPIYPSVVFIILLMQGTSQPAFGQAASDSGTIAVDEFNLRYKIEGEGKPTLVIGSSIYYPRTFSKNLRKHLKFVFLDHRGSAPYPGKLDTVSYSLARLYGLSNFEGIIYS